MRDELAEGLVTRHLSLITYHFPPSLFSWSGRKRGAGEATRALAGDSGLPHEKIIQKRAHRAREKQDQDPSHAVVGVPGRLRRLGAVCDHPNPKGKKGEAEQPGKREKEYHTDANTSSERLGSDLSEERGGEHGGEWQK